MFIRWPVRNCYITLTHLKWAGQARNLCCLLNLEGTVPKFIAKGLNSRENSDLRGEVSKTNGWVQEKVDD